MLALADLSPRQRQLAELVTSGLDGPALARHLGLSHKRVRQCLCDLYRLLELPGRMDLARWHWQTQCRAALTPEQRDAARTRLALLRPREQGVARLVGDGLDNGAIAGRLGVSDKTVRNRLSELYELLELPGRVALARLVWEADLADSDT